MRPLHGDEIILLQFLIKSSQLKNEFFNDDPAPILKTLSLRIGDGEGHCSLSTLSTFCVMSVTIKKIIAGL